MREDPRGKILDMVDEGLLSESDMLSACLGYMSHDDVRDMAHANEICLGCGDFHNCSCDEDD